MQPLLRKLHGALLIGVALTMPFSISHANLNGLCIVLLAANAIPLFLLTRKTISPLFSGKMILFVSVYLILVPGLLYADNFHQAGFELEKKMSLFIFPLVLFYSPRLKGKEVRIILLSFVFGCLVTGLFCIGMATYRFIESNDSSFFFHHELSGLAGMHAAYLSMYCCFSIAILLCNYSEELGLLRLRDRMLYYVCLCIFVILIFLLASRTQLLILFIGSIGYFTFHFSKKYTLLKSVLGAIAIGVFIVSLAFLFPKNRERFKEAINYKGEYSLSTKWGEQQMRPLMWSCAIELIKDNPIKGAGTGDGEDELQKCYSRNDYVSLLYFENSRFNAHNQFLEIAVELGLIGLLVFLLSLFAPAAEAWRHKKVLYLIFVLVFAVSCLTESMLERQNGVVFFGFFNSFLVFNSVKS